jgi:tetratricopeptide (TPR) repeat protein
LGSVRRLMLIRMLWGNLGDRRMLRSLVFVVVIAVSLPAHAQLTAPVKNGDTTITVTGTRTRDSKVEMSNWRMAETPHVVVFSQNDEEELRDAAHNLEKIHFVLSALLGRVDVPDETIKIAITMIGDAGPFEQLRLTDLRWQYGPFPERFAKTIYYDPREEGSVLATTKEGVNLVLRPSLGRPTKRNCTWGDGDSPLVSFAGGPPPPTATPEQVARLLPANELAFCQSAESRLYAGFAQNYLMTYFPAAYPRWFLQGFGEIFATMKAGDDFVEYGHRPPGFTEVMEHYQYTGYPVADILDGRYLFGRRAWTPHHAWRLVHLLYFSDEWKPRLHSYLSAIARGADPKSAASAFGDPAHLQEALTFYRGRKVQVERMNFPAERAPEPTVRRMTRAEAGLIRGRLELGARIEVPAKEGPEHAAALARRSDWLARLRENARQFPNLIEHQLLLAEAECRTGNPQECLEAAERAIAQSPRDATALVWKGTALAQLAARAPATERQRRLKEARSFIVRANRLDKEGILPLIAFYNSFAVAGSQAPDMAVEGLAKVVDSSPAAPSPRLKLGEEFIKRDLDDAARNTLLPVANGAFETPERPAATALLPLPDARATEPGS